MWYNKGEWLPIILSKVWEANVAQFMTCHFGLGPMQKAYY